MSGLNRSFNILRATLRQQITPRASISSKPAKHEVTAAETAFVLGVMFATILGPSGWILANLENYKKKA